jgi:DNA segregation ATPase FtsK/SpoIIIE, S-DNA-T family
MNYLIRIFGHSKIRSTTLFVLSWVIFISLATYSSSDPSFNLVTNNYPNNMLLHFGSYLSDLLFQIMGLAAFVVPVCSIIWSYILFRDGKINMFSFRALSMIISIYFLSSTLNSLQVNSMPSGAGGLTGISFWYFFKNYLNITIYEEYIRASCVVLSIIFLILSLGIKFKTYVTVITIFTKSCSFVLKLVKKIGIIDIVQKAFTKLGSFDSGKAYYAQDEFAVITPSEKSKKTPSSAPRKTETQSTKPSTNIQNIQTEIGKSALPDIGLLDEASEQNTKPQSQSELREKSDMLLSVLQDFGVKGQINDVREGPVVTMYEFEPAAGTKSSRVIGLSDDIARSLSATSTRISVIPGKNALGIELPNKKRMFFRLKELIKTPEFQDPQILLPLVLGKDLVGSPLIADLAKMPHLLVAGTTGSGKSVAINAMIMSLLYKYTPQECRMIMIDPKMLELSAYDNIPHLMTPVVTEPGKAVVALKWAVKEMENRYRLMSHLGVRNIANYNAKVQDAIKKGQILERKIQTGFDPETGKPIYDVVPIEMTNMPFIVVIVDEMADLMLVAGKDIETSIQRLAQMARAAGIHIIMATQRPSVDVITGVIKANFPSRISFKVTSKIDSRTILGEQGSEQLLGMGDMLYMGSSSKILRVHGPFVDDTEVERVTNFLRENGTPEYVSAVTESNDEDLYEANISQAGGKNIGGEDNLYTQAVNIVRTERKSSVSYIQRSLRIGYNKAANLVEEMQRNGVLSEPNHSGKREILLPED